MDPSNLAVVFLAAVAAGGLAYVFIYPILSGEKRAEKRQQALTKGDRRAERGAATGTNRRDSVAQSLKEIEARQKARSKVTLDDRLAHAGLDWTKARFFLMSAVLGLALAAILYVLTRTPAVALLGGFTGAVGVPQWILVYLRNRRTSKFIEELPNAMDIIVRGIRAGLPLGDCIREIASSASEPLRTEFRMVVESQSVGVPLAEGLTKLYERVPVQEANFLATVITIQTKSGGNLSEAIGNLSRVLRERKKMKGKISAMSMEAKASAAIIASLPFVVAVLTYMSSPDYIELLWTTTAGKLVLGVCAFWMTIGVLVMKKMISFDV